MEATNDFKAAETARVAVRLPAFWTERPSLWFTQAEAQFSLAGISNERTKFYHIICELGQRARQITHEDMGGRKPSQFLRHLRSLALNLPEYFLRSIW
jgi:hypothetical protein